ncbi:hypothetical protein ACJJIW_20990 [Microbulbifer sp. JMSA004]|uniref:hypothetical protein n=1 Tax=Microbulbifer sp. JMSA004 TaxID=3243370 RepID=UPI00403A54F4
MAYKSSSGLPMERASKIAHMKLIQDDSVIELLQSFHSDEVPVQPAGLEVTGNISPYAEGKNCIRYVVTIDGGLSVVPSPVKREKTLAFIQVGTCLLKVDDLNEMQATPMMDPREIQERLNKISYRPTILPLSGVRRPGMSVKHTIRSCINGVLSSAYTNLYPVLEFLLFRKWDTAAQYKPPSMECYECRATIVVPQRSKLFSCSDCGHEHFLSDYLQIGQEGSEEWSKEDTAYALMAVLETLSLFEIPSYLVSHNRAEELKEILFVKDGPLLLRAALSRLVDPIREFVAWTRDCGFSLHLVGVEKNGDFTNFFSEHKGVFTNQGDFFLPTVQFLVEEVSGRQFDTETYRNRVNYGAKVAIKLGGHHHVVLNVPTGEFCTNPMPADLIGFNRIVRALFTLLSSRYENALIPLVLANEAVSLSREPSSGILKDFVDKMIPENA